MPELYKVDSPITREQRNNLNATFQDILNRFTNLRYQISILAGGADLEEIIQRIENTITNANNTTANTQQVLDDISEALNQLSTALQNSDNAADNANDAATNAQNEISNMQNFVNQLGNAESYDSNKTYLKNNIVEYNGSSFIALQQTTGNTPPTLPTKRNDFWQLLAQRGVDGSGSVSSVNAKSPNVDGNVELVPSDISAASKTEFDTHSEQGIVDNVHGLRDELQKEKVSVKWYGAVGDGVTDDTAAFQAAIDFVFSRGGGIVLVPTSENGYVINGSLDLKRYVTLEGADLVEGDKYDDGVVSYSGSTILVTGGEGTTDGQCIMMQTASKVKNLKFFYPNQSTTSTVINFPPTIRLLPSGGNGCSIDNVFLTNSFIGIDASGPHERLNINNVKGQPVYGIRIGGNFDVDRINNVHFYPYWSIDPSIGDSYASSVLYNGIGIDITRADNIQISNSFFYGYNNGVNLKNNSYGTMVNCGFDYCYRCIQVEDGGISLNGWYVSNTTLISGDYLRGVTGICINIVGGDAQIGTMHLSNCGFWVGDNGQSNIIANKGNIIATGCSFYSWRGAQSIYISGTLGVQLIGCKFDQVGNQISYDVSATKGAVVIGARTNGALTIYNPNNLQQQLIGNVDVI